MAKAQSIFKLLLCSEEHVIVNIAVLLCPRNEETNVVELLGRFIFQEISFPCMPVLVNSSEGKSRPFAKIVWLYVPNLRYCIEVQYDQLGFHKSLA